MEESQGRLIGMSRLSSQREPGRRPTQEELACLKERRASQYEGKTAHFSLCVFNLMNAILGSGILGLANAVANLGYALFSVLLVLVAALAFNSIRLLLDMCDLTGITSYEAIGKAAFGKGGKIVTALSIFTHTLGAMCSFLFIVKYELPEVLRTLTKADECSSAWYLNGDIIVIIVTVAVVMPLSAAKNIGFLGYTSGFAMACMIFFTVVSAYAVPTMVFAFQCHASVLPIYLELTKPTKGRMQVVAIVSIGNIFLLYFIASLFGYLTFFSAVGPELLLMYSAYDPNNIIILLARIMVLICVIFSTPLLHFPARRSIENLFFASKPFSWFRHLGIMVFLLSLTDLMVIYVPTIREIFGFIGATSASMLVIILPSLFYLRLGLEPWCSAKKISCIFLVVFGIAFAITSLILIILSWL